MKLFFYFKIHCLQMLQLFQTRDGPIFFIVTLVYIVTLFLATLSTSVIIVSVKRMGHLFQTFAEMDIKFSYITSCAQNAKIEEGTCYSLSHRYSLTKMQPSGNLLPFYAVSKVFYH